MGVFNSEGGLPTLKKRNSRKMGNLPGDEPIKKPLDRKRAEKHFVKLINKFMRIEWFLSKKI